MSHDDYTARINRVLDHVETHLHEELRLRDLARVACFSEFHFHRIFAAMTGETPNRFIQRLRVEKAAGRLITNRKVPITTVALDCGFSSPAAFARAFRAHFAMSASQWRAGGWKDRKIGQTDRKLRDTLRNLREALQVSSPYLDPTSNHLRWRIEMKGQSTLTAEVEVIEREPVQVAYIRHTGPYAGDGDLFAGLWERLCRWAGPRGLLQPPTTEMLCIYHDSPEITEQDKLRLSVCVSVPAGTEVDGEVGTMTVEGGQYAAARFELHPHEYGDAWNSFYGWLPDSGFQPDDRPAFEQFLGDPKDHPEGKHTVAIHVPVRPL
jgi:AraC family transcriptional regulator